MKGRVTGMAMAAALLGGCGPNTRLQDLIALPLLTDSGMTETGSLSVRPGVHEPHEASVLVPGTPTGVFAEVARGALGCWFAADGPLKASHVYRAEAQPPAKGGDAEIVIYERDGAERDVRGPRAYRIGFAAELSGVRVTMASQRFEAKLAQAMAKDVESWAKGGEGCELRAVLAPSPAPQVTAKKTAKSAKSAKGQPASKAVAPGKGTP